MSVINRATGDSPRASLACVTCGIKANELVNQQISKNHLGSMAGKDKTASSDVHALPGHVSRDEHMLGLTICKSVLHDKCLK